MNLLRKNIEKSRLPVIFLFILAIASLAACGGSSDSSQPSAPATTAPAQQSSETTNEPTTTEGVRVIEVVVAFIEPHFTPDVIVVNVGEPVQFSITSADTRHTFTVAELGVDLPVAQSLIGTTSLSEVIIPQETGIFVFRCTLHNNPSVGVGSLEVVQ